MQALALGYHFSGGYVKGGEQGGSSMADLVVSNTLYLPQPHGQQRLGVIESMNLGLSSTQSTIALSVGFR